MSLIGVDRRLAVVHILRLLWLAALCALAMSAAADVPVPPLKSRVTDLTATLTAQQRADLEQRLAAFETRKGSQIAVLLVPTTRPEEIEQYSIRVVDQWKLGRKGVDDGTLLLIAKDDRRVRIEVGYGLEGVIPDATAKRIVSDVIVPSFKQGDFYGGILAGVDRIMRVIEGEPLPLPPPRPRASPASGVDFETLLVIGFALVFGVGGVLRARFGRFLGSGIVGAIAGGIVWMLAGALFFALVAGLLAFVFALLAGGRSSYGGWPTGGWGGGWGGGGYSGGGFDGGGGGFGGGGASGRW